MFYVLNAHFVENNVIASEKTAHTYLHFAHYTHASKSPALICSGHFSFCELHLESVKTNDDVVIWYRRSTKNWMPIALQYNLIACERRTVKWIQSVHFNKYEYLILINENNQNWLKSKAERNSVHFHQIRYIDYYLFTDARWPFIYQYLAFFLRFFLFSFHENRTFIIICTDAHFTFVRIVKKKRGSIFS